MNITYITNATVVPTPPLYPCVTDPVIGYVIGIGLCVGGLVSYIPQYRTLLKTQSHTGISQFSLFLLNISGACLALNSLIFNWSTFQCFSHCSTALCLAKLLPLIQISINWLVVFPLYLIFLRLKIKASTKSCAYQLGYLVSYLCVLSIGLIVSIVEKERGNYAALRVVARVAGIASALSAVVTWFPQIILLLRTQDGGSLSLLMFTLQVPGTVIIIVFQAILYHQDLTTWLPYVVYGVEQLFIIVLLIAFKVRTRRTERVNDVMRQQEIKRLLE